MGSALWLGNWAVLQGCVAPQEPLAMPSSLLIPSLAGLSKRKKKCHEKISPWPNPAPWISFPWPNPAPWIPGQTLSMDPWANPAPWIPLLWAGMLLHAVQPLLEQRERAAPHFSPGRQNPPGLSQAPACPRCGLWQLCSLGTPWQPQGMAWQRCCHPGKALET